MIVKFENVGRSKQCWSENLKDSEWPTLYRAVKRKSVLASKEIDFIDGKIIVGGFREVGTYTVEHQN